MRVVHISQTPIAGACHYWSEAFREAGYQSWSICSRSYKDGRSFHSDFKWPPNETAVRLLKRADLIVCHQGHPYQQGWYPRHIPTVAVYHSQPQHVSRAAEGDGWPAACLGQYHTRLYPELPMVPNLIPLRHPLFQVGEKPKNHVRIVYSPSNTHLPAWDNKGYTETVRMLSHLTATCPHVRSDVITSTPHAKVMEWKSQAHICIDECATGSYHRSSLEAMAVGCEAVNNCDDLCYQNILRMMDGPGPIFQTTDMAGLERTLRSLVDLGPETLAERGWANRRWMEYAWSPEGLIRRNLQPLMRAATEKATCTTWKATGIGAAT